MPVSPTDHKPIISSRVTAAVRDEVRQIAQDEGETESTIIRRLLRLGLEVTRAQTIAATLVRRRG